MITEKTAQEICELYGELSTAEHIRDRILAGAKPAIFVDDDEGGFESMLLLVNDALTLLADRIKFINIAMGAHQAQAREELEASNG
ncbi:hypothetical protein LQZ19_08510 [Treponema primitia]|uniref:hypothetical protein n=1 Tax=Treponema primitia TaxID=88058 RepID=UPI00398047FF